MIKIAKLLAQHRIGCIVIVGEDDKIAGIVSERDIPGDCAGVGNMNTRAIDNETSART